jgi:hypothetical protein
MKLSYKTPTIPLPFWDELFKAPISEYPGIVRKYNLDAEQLNYVVSQKEEVFGRMQASEDGRKSWNDGASKYYSKF